MWSTEVLNIAFTKQLEHLEESAVDKLKGVLMAVRSQIIFLSKCKRTEAK